MIQVGNTILETVQSIRPKRILDIGCGCGQFTTQLAPYCGEITAIDISQGLIDRCVRENSVPNVRFECLDATSLPFPGRSFDVVLERATLHHISNWRGAVEEMIRISSKYILIEEPIDDLRNEAKRRTVWAQDLLLELQREAGYSHFRHLEPKTLEDCLRDMGLAFECRITEDDRVVQFEDFFDNYPEFAKRTQRPAYWIERLEQFRESLSETSLSEDDMLLLAAQKNLNEETYTLIDICSNLAVVVLSPQRILWRISGELVYSLS